MRDWLLSFLAAAGLVALVIWTVSVLVRVFTPKRKGALWLIFCLLTNK